MDVFHVRNGDVGNGDVRNGHVGNVTVSIRSLELGTGYCHGYVGSGHVRNGDMGNGDVDQHGNTLPVTCNSAAICDNAFYLLLRSL